MYSHRESTTEYHFHPYIIVKFGLLVFDLCTPTFFSYFFRDSMLISYLQDKILQHANFPLILWCQISYFLFLMLISCKQTVDEVSRLNNKMIMKNV